MNEKQEKLFDRIVEMTTEAEIPAPTDEQREMVTDVLSLWPDLAVDLLNDQITKAKEDKIDPVLIVWGIMEKCQAINELLRILSAEEVEARLREETESRELIE